MKYILFILISMLSFSLFAAPTSQKTYNFHYKAPHAKAFTISRSAASKDEAFRLAAKECFSKLTNNKYPGEEKGLEIIDICANPKI